MPTNIVQEVKDIEEKAQIMIKEAEEKGKEQLLNAEKERTKQIAENQKLADEHYQETIVQTNVEAGKIQEKINKETEQEITKIKQISKDRIDKAVDLVINKIKERWGKPDSIKS